MIAIVKAGHLVARLPMNAYPVPTEMQQCIDKSWIGDRLAFSATRMGSENG